MKPKKIPQTDSTRELAEFWDTHDLTDFEDELEEVHEPALKGITTLSIFKNYERNTKLQIWIR